MSVQLKHGVYYFISREPGTRKQTWRRLRSRTERDARQEGKILEGERIKRRKYPDLFPAERRQIPWSEMVEKYLETSEGDGNASSTLARKRLVFRQVDKVMGLRLTSDWTIERLEDFKVRARRDGLAPGTINKELGYIKAVLRLARRLKYVALSADEAGDVRQVRNRPAAQAYYQPEEQAKLLMVASRWWCVAILLGGLAGLRRGEVLSLRWRDVDFERRELRVVDRVEWREKTRKSKTIPLHPDLLLILKEWRARHPGEEMVLPAQMTPLAFTREFGRIRRRAGLAAGSFKSLRHGFGTGLMRQGTSTIKVQHAMGHSSVLTTQHYMHVYAADLEEPISKLPSPLGLIGKTANHSANQIAYEGRSGTKSSNTPLDGRV